MFIHQFYTGCLSEAAYYIESGGEAAVVDPLRDIDVYVEMARERNASIKYIFETHFHADFVSGHLDLSKKTGAPIIFGPNTTTSYPVQIAKDGEVFKLGDSTIEILHTPGHTIESSCFLLRDEQNEPKAIFTGDTLFVGDVGRPDLSSGNLSKEELASNLYNSIQKKIIPLEDNIVVYPAHGAGSSCKNLGPETFSTIGEEKRNNYALQLKSKEEFIKSVTEGLDDVPEYFWVNAKINKEGYDSLDSIKIKSLRAVALKEFKEGIKNAVILDTRPAEVFTFGFVPGSIFIGLEGRFAQWAASVLSFDKPVFLVTETGKEEETIVRMARVGFNNIQGYLEGGFETWRKAKEPIDMIIDVEPSELMMDLKYDKNLEVLDVRKETEFSDGHVKNSINLPLAKLANNSGLEKIDLKKNLYLICSRGYRSVIAASILKKKGIHNLHNIAGGWKRINEESSVAIDKDSSILN